MAVSAAVGLGAGLLAGGLGAGATAATFAGVAVGSSALAHKNEKAALKEQRKAQRREARQAGIRNARARRRQAAQVVQIQAQAEQMAINRGVGSSSVTQGITSSLETQKAANVSFQSQLQELEDSKQRSLDRAGKHKSKALTFQAISDLTFRMAGAAG